jgi:predicted Zn-ribbon and HTH transcriptional regulator
MICKTCGNEYSEDCNHRQGRCPHHKSMIDEIMLDTYKTRYYNLINSIRNLFKHDHK